MGQPRLWSARRTVALRSLPGEAPALAGRTSHGRPRQSRRDSDARALDWLLIDGALSVVTPRPRILVVDDEAPLAELVGGYLRREGYEVLTAGDGLAAVDLARAERPDLVVLDLMLPGLDGVEVCRRLRQFSDAYVLMLTAKAEEVDKLVGLAVGADDYVTKPFSPRELVARVKALLRRPRGALMDQGPTAEPEAPPVRRYGELTLDEGRHEVTKGRASVPLTAREFALLAALAAHPRRVFTRAQLLERVWGDEYYDDHVVDVHVANLRKKLEEDPARPRYVETVRGVGYRFGVEPG
jgi:two-component system, OmpR family, alkaline phosphatase synthesis response regulator PhoP